MEENKTTTTGADTPSSKVEKYLRENKKYLENNVPQKQEDGVLSGLHRSKNKSYLRFAGHGNKLGR